MSAVARCFELGQHHSLRFHRSNPIGTRGIRGRTSRVPSPRRLLGCLHRRHDSIRRGMSGSWSSYKLLSQRLLSFVSVRHEYLISILYPFDFWLVGSKKMEFVSGLSRPENEYSDQLPTMEFVLSSMSHLILWPIGFRVKKVGEEKHGGNCGEGSRCMEKDFFKNNW